MRSRREQIALLLGERKRSVVALALLSIASGIVEAAMLAIIAQVASTLAKGSKHVHASIAHIAVNTSTVTMIEIAFALTIVRLLIQVPLSLIPARIGSEVQSSLRVRLFAAYTRASWGMQSQDIEGQLQETITNQISQATTGALQTTSLITSSFSFIVLMAAAFALNPIAALLVGFTSTLMFGALRPLRGRGINSARALSKAQVKFARAVAEATRVAQEVNVFGVVEVQRERMDRFVQEAKNRFFRTQVLQRMVANVYQSLIYILIVAGLAGLYVAGHTHAGALAAVILVLMRAATAGQLIQGNYQGIAQAVPFIERSTEAIDRYEESAESDGGQPLGSVENVAFEHVSFAYNEGRPVLADISFEVDQGEVIGIIGPSGAGKSTLVQLLLRLRPPSDGDYLVNGRPAAEFSREDWHRQVSYVPQEPRLLHATVAENIRFFRELPDEEVERAARLARIHEDIMSWPKGYGTTVGPRADAVSGGQQQRICLARALVARPEVLVLDEPTSALDPNSEALIGESLRALKSELTLFIIAHRMSTLDICDRVMVIVDGRLVAFDTKTLLQENNPYYQHASTLALGSSVQDS
jgi:ABC-type multidrug transport system fused ATPase/permease subunit